MPFEPFQSLDLPEQTLAYQSLVEFINQSAYSELCQPILQQEAPAPSTLLLRFNQTGAESFDTLQTQFQTAGFILSFTNSITTLETHETFDEFDEPSEDIGALNDWINDDLLLGPETLSDDEYALEYYVTQVDRELVLEPDESSYQLGHVSGISGDELDDYIESVYNFDNLIGHASQSISVEDSNDYSAYPEGVTEETWAAIPQTIKQHWANLAPPQADEQAPALSPLQQYVITCCQDENYQTLANLNHSAELGESFNSPISLLPPAIPVRIPQGIDEGDLAIPGVSPTLYDLREMLYLELYVDTIIIEETGQEEARPDRAPFRLNPTTRGAFHLHEIIPAPDALASIQDRLPLHPLKSQLKRMAKEAYPTEPRAITASPSFFDEAAEPHPHFSALEAIYRTKHSFEALQEELRTFMDREDVAIDHRPLLTLLNSIIDSETLVDALHCLETSNNIPCTP